MRFLNRYLWDGFYNLSVRNRLTSFFPHEVPA
jgi:hypothetical protein